MIRWAPGRPVHGCPPAHRTSQEFCSLRPSPPFFECVYIWFDRSPQDVAGLLSITRGWGNNNRVGCTARWRIIITGAGEKLMEMDAAAWLGLDLLVLAQTLTEEWVVLFLTRVGFSKGRAVIKRVFHPPIQHEYVGQVWSASQPYQRL